MKTLNCVLNDLKYLLPLRIVQQKGQIQMVLLKT